MFQNIAKDFEENQNSYEEVELNKKTRIKETKRIGKVNRNNETPDAKSASISLFAYISLKT